MKVLSSILTVALGFVAAAEHVGLLLWGVIWPVWHLAQYPGDGGVNRFTAAASLLFLAFSLAGAADLRRAMPRPGWPLTLAALALALPCGVGVTFALMRVLFLDPVIAYVSLVPGLGALVAPYWLAAVAARRMPVERFASIPSTGPING